MNVHKSLYTVVALATLALSSPVQAQDAKGKILVILSSESELPLKDGKAYRTGYYLNELVVPAQKFSQAGYELVFADPKGNAPTVDAGSINPDYFGGSKDALAAAEQFQGQLTGLDHPLTLKQAIQGGLAQYKAVFVPGGPAPMIDLMASPELGTILRYFHDHRMTTVLLCHGPIALLSATRDPAAYQAALRAGDLGKARELSSGWPYKNYKMTIFSDEEEVIAAETAFHGEPQFFPEQALKAAGGTVAAVAAWHPNVVQDRELITGQNPFSDSAMMDVVLPILAARK